MVSPSRVHQALLVFPNERRVRALLPRWCNCMGSNLIVSFSRTRSNPVLFATHIEQLALIIPQVFPACAF